MPPNDFKQEIIMIKFVSGKYCRSIGIAWQEAESKWGDWLREYISNRDKKWYLELDF